jgi:hypothetical protein
MLHIFITPNRKLAALDKAFGNTIGARSYLLQPPKMFPRLPFRHKALKAPSLYSPPRCPLRIRHSATSSSTSQIQPQMEPQTIKIEIVKQLATFTARLPNARFPYYGPLYSAKDIPNIKGTQVDNTFSVGPTISRTWFDDKRGDVVIYHGPCKTVAHIIA